MDVVIFFNHFRSLQHGLDIICTDIPLLHTYDCMAFECDPVTCNKFGQNRIIKYAQYFISLMRTIQSGTALICASESIILYGICNMQLDGNVLGEKNKVIIGSEYR